MMNLLPIIFLLASPQLYVIGPSESEIKANEGVARITGPQLAIGISNSRQLGEVEKIFLDGRECRLCEQWLQEDESPLIMVPTRWLEFGVHEVRVQFKSEIELRVLFEFSSGVSVQMGGTDR